MGSCFASRFTRTSTRNKELTPFLVTMALKNTPPLTERFISMTDGYIRASLDTVKEMRDTLIEEAFPDDHLWAIPQSGWETEFPPSIESMLPYLVCREKKKSRPRKDGTRPKEFILILGTTGCNYSYWVRWNLGALAYYAPSLAYDKNTGQYYTEGIVGTNNEMRSSGLKTVLDVLNFLKGKRVRCTGCKSVKNQINDSYDDKAPSYLMESRFLSVYVPQIEIIGEGTGYCFSRNACTGILNKSSRDLEIPPVSVDRDGVPYSVSIIHKSAFSRLTSIETVNLYYLKNVELQDYAFYGCTGLKELVFDTVKWIGKSAFAGCSSLERVEFPYGADYLMDAAFKDCSALTTVVFKNTPQLTRIGAEAFSGCTRLNHIEIPDTVVEIADYAFCNCISLTQITLPVNIRRIGVGAFKGCINLERVITPNQTIDIAPDAFDGCYRML